jgi:hypothetical protein
MLVRLTLAALLAAVSLNASLAAPSRLIILRHGEKATAWKLCNVGQDRATALTTSYLGRAAKDSLFKPGEAPAAILAITLHTLELVAPSASSWGTPVTLYSVMPRKDSDDSLPEAALNRRTQEAARDALSNPQWKGKTVVMVWEHKHIANAKLVDDFKGEEVTLRQLLKLDKLQGVPDTWPSSNYDYFWIVDFADGGDLPTSFRMVKQEFGPDYAEVPSNEWGAPNGLKKKSGCKLKGSD